MALWVALASGCSEPKSSDDGDGSEGGADDSGGGPSGPPHATLLLEVSQSICDTVGVVGVQARARRVGCEHPPPAPCTVPANPTDVLGDEVSCPISDPTVLLGVTVEDPGRYLVDSVARQDGADPITSCYASSAMATDVLVTSVDLEIRAEKKLIAIGSACPDP